MKNLAILFDLDENWIGGSYYIRNLLCALNTLPVSEQPTVTLVGNLARSYLFLAEIGYSKLAWITQAQFSADPDSFPFDAIFWHPIAGQEYRTVSWIPDLQEHHLPQYFSEAEIETRRKTHRWCFETRGVIVSSCNVAADIERFYPEIQKKVTVVNFATFNAFDSAKFDSVASVYNVPASYIMCPNQVWMHKNHLVVLRALRILKERGICIQVYFTGNESDYRAGGYSHFLKRLVDEWGLSDRAHFLGFIPREDQLILMKGARYILQPSLFEGWSTVVEDAKAMNKFVVASDIEVHKEQLVRNAKFFAARNPNSLANLMADLEAQAPVVEAFDYLNSQARFGREFLAAVTQFVSQERPPGLPETMAVEAFTALSEGNISRASGSDHGEPRAEPGIFPAQATSSRIEISDALQQVALRFLDTDWYGRVRGLEAASADAIRADFLNQALTDEVPPNRFFDPKLYRALHPDSANSGLSAFYHYLAVGLEDGRQPHPLFDPEFYRLRYVDVTHSGEPAFLHFCSHGAQEDRQPHPLFDPMFYRAFNPQMGDSHLSAFEHFLSCGIAENLRSSPYFDPEFYASQYPEFESDDESPLLDFILRGRHIGRRPNILFRPDLYLAMNQDVQAAGIEPFFHLLRYGLPEGRSPSPLFDPHFYLARNPEVAAAGSEPFAHFLMDGLREGRQPHLLFDNVFYKDQYLPDVDDAPVAFEHFVRIGLARGLRPNPYFIPAYYAARYPDARLSKLAPFEHFLIFGQNKNYTGSPLFDSEEYLRRNSEVSSSGLRSLDHFIRWGRSEGRVAYTGAAAKRGFSGALEYYARHIG